MSQVWPLTLNAHQNQTGRSLWSALLPLCNFRMSVGLMFMPRIHLYVCSYQERYKSTEDQLVSFFPLEQNKTKNKQNKTNIFSFCTRNSNKTPNWKASAKEVTGSCSDASYSCGSALPTSLPATTAHCNPQDESLGPERPRKPWMTQISVILVTKDHCTGPLHGPWRGWLQLPGGPVSEA